MSYTKEVSIKAENAINAFIVSTEWNRSYNHETKKLFHSRGKKVMNIIKEVLGVKADIRSCLGGVAIGGDVILHADNLYVSFGSDRILYRYCIDRKDYKGGYNNWMEYKELRNIQGVCDQFKRVMEGRR